MFWKSETRWGIILSGGEGTRLEQFIKRIYGIVRPKQYCALVGTRTMLQHTLDRAKSLLPPQKILTVVNQTHLKYVQTQLPGQLPETILVQPCSRETATGILLSLLHVYAEDPDAVVCIFPSDHFILEEEKFMQYVDRAFDFAATHRDAIIVLGAPPSHVEPEYGWIEKNDAVTNPWNVQLHRVGRFWEKPNRLIADKLFRTGCVWNTMVLAGSVMTFLSFFKSIVPETFNILNEIVQTKNPNERSTLLNLIYPDLPSLDFSKTILERCANRLLVMEISDICWSDWGNESRVLRDIEHLHLKLPHHPVHAFG